MGINRVRLDTVHGSDQGKALDLYTNQRGFVPRSDTRYNEGFRWIEVRPPEGRSALPLVKPYRGQSDSLPGGGGARLVFGTQAVDTTYQELGGRGVVFTERPAPRPFGIKQAIFDDPDGNVFVPVER